MRRNAFTLDGALKESVRQSAQHTGLSDFKQLSHHSHEITDGSWTRRASLDHLSSCSHQMYPFDGSFTIITWVHGSSRIKSPKSITAGLTHLNLFPSFRSGISVPNKQQCMSPTPDGFDKIKPPHIQPSVSI
ncbi:unnamed protein product, partial [Ixodes persulcatus]